MKKGKYETIWEEWPEWLKDLNERQKSVNAVTRPTGKEIVNEAILEAWNNGTLGIPIIPKGPK